MARHRVIKPEYFTNEQVVECSTNARLLFVGMWCFCDDGGIHPASAARLKMEVFPADAFGNDQILEWISELKNVGLLESYLFEGKEFWRVTGWHHQKIDKPTYSYPGSQKFGEQAAMRRRGLVEVSAAERKGVERSGAEGSEGESSGVEQRLSMGDRKTNGVAKPDRVDSRSASRSHSPRSPKSADVEGRREEPYDLSLVDWSRVEVWAERLGRNIPPRTIDDRRMWLKFAVMADVTFGEEWLSDGIEAVMQAKETRSTRQGHLVGVLKSKASEDHGVNEATFLAMLGRIEIPKDVWKSGVLEIRK